MTELKPCKRCKNGKPELQHYSLGPGDAMARSQWSVYVCQNCGWQAESGRSDEEAKNNWNTRTPSPAEVERLADQIIHWAKAAGRIRQEDNEEAEKILASAKSRLLAALTNTIPYLSGDVKGWLPIETAPKDGTRVKLLTQGGKEDIGYWSNYPRYNPDDLPGEWSTEFGNCDTPITHWMPLPEPPDRKAGE